MQYFATVEPQRRGAPHAHIAIRGTLPRALVKELTAATYATIWWPPTTTPVYLDPDVPEWDPDITAGPAATSTPTPASPCPTWQEALDDLETRPRTRTTTRRAESLGT